MQQTKQLALFIVRLVTVPQMVVLEQYTVLKVLEVVLQWMVQLKVSIAVLVRVLLISPQELYTVPKPHTVVQQQI